MGFATLCIRSHGAITMMTIIEKVLLLQDVDVLSGMTSEQLSFVAAIAQETSVQPDWVIYREGVPPDGLYVVVSGSVRMQRGKEEIDRIMPNGAFGIWALFDNEPRLTTAIAAEESRLLFVSRERFFDVLSDHVDIVEGILKQLAQRLRRLASAVDKNYALSDSVDR
ncbi:MAG: cyclic nucleotide-binding protein [Acidobacteria bacterium]|nr:cyclic nucleotide-binding protein [Acidobacteriota bacterium]